MLGLSIPLHVRHSFSHPYLLKQTNMNHLYCSYVCYLSPSISLFLVLSISLISLSLSLSLSVSFSHSVFTFLILVSSPAEQC